MTFLLRRDLIKLKFITIWRKCFQNFYFINLTSFSLGIFWFNRRLVLCKNFCYFYLPFSINLYAWMFALRKLCQNSLIRINFIRILIINSNLTRLITPKLSLNNESIEFQLNSFHYCDNQISKFLVTSILLYFTQLWQEKTSS